MVAEKLVAARPVPATAPRWGFLTNHALALVYVVLHPGSTVRQIAGDIGITERATLAILRDLDEDEIIERHRDGRRNTYSVDFSHLSRVRRGGVASPLTPRLFVEVVVKTLYDMADAQGTLPAGATPPTKVSEDDLTPRQGSWGFFTNHMLILLAMARDRTLTVRDLATTVGITERAVVGIINQMENEDVIARTRDGRRNTYAIDYEKFRGFRGWSTGQWRLPPALIDIAANGIRALSGS